MHRKILSLLAASLFATACAQTDVDGDVEPTPSTAPDRPPSPDTGPSTDPGTEPDMRADMDSAPDASPDARPDPEPMHPTPIAATHFVDRDRGSDDASGETPETAWRTLGKAAKTARAGDVVEIAAGRYADDPLRLERSGSPDAPIVFRAAEGAEVLLTNTKVAIPCDGASHIVIEGLDVDGMGRFRGSSVESFATFEGCAHIAIRRVWWRRARGWAGVKVEDDSRHILIEDSIIEDVGEYSVDDRGRLLLPPTYDDASKDMGDVLDIRGDFFVLRRSLVRLGGHGLGRIGGSFAVIQDNVFENTYQDVHAGAPGAEDYGNRSLEISTKGSGARANGFNLVERNVIRRIGRNADTERPSSAMKVEGTGNIVRFNVFAHTQGGAIQTSSRTADAATRAVGNRIYHNTFLDIGLELWRVRAYRKGGELELMDNAFEGNLQLTIAESRGAREEFGIYAQIYDEPVRQTRVRHNCLDVSQRPEPEVVIKGGGNTMNLAEAERDHHDTFSDNATERPKVVDPTTILGEGDAATLREGLALEADDPCRGVRAHLARTRTSARETTTIPVDRAWAFAGRRTSDLFTLHDGDLVSIDGVEVRVLSVDRDRHEIEVGAPVSFDEGAEVRLVAAGAAGAMP